MDRKDEKSVKSRIREGKSMKRKKNPRENGQRENRSITKRSERQINQ